MTTANPYVCSDVASSQDVSVPYCDSEDDTEYHNGLGSDALIDDINLEANFQQDLRRHHDKEHEAHERTSEHFHNWKKEHKSTVDRMRTTHQQRNKEHQKSGHTAAGKKAHKDNKKDKKNQGKMSKFDSEFSRLYSTWKQMSHTLFHKAWLESRKIIEMQESDTKNILTSEYMLNYGDSPFMVKYLSDSGTIFKDISEDSKFDNLVENIKTLRTAIDNAVVIQKQFTAGKNKKSFQAITGGN